MRNWSDKTDNTAPAAGGILTADEDNARFKELENAVLTGGQLLDPAAGPDTRFDQLAEAMSRAASGGIHFQDTGAVNTYVLTTPYGGSGFVHPKAFFLGMWAFWVPANTNTGAATANVNGLGVKAIRTWDDQAVAAKVIVQGRPMVMYYNPAANGAAGAWLIPDWANGLASGDPYQRPAQGLIVQCNNQLITRNAQTTLSSFSSTQNNLKNVTFAAGVLTLTSAAAEGYYTISSAIRKTTSSRLNNFLIKNGATIGVGLGSDSADAGLAASVTRTLYLVNGDAVRNDMSWNNVANSGGAETIDGTMSGFSIFFQGK